VINGLEMRMNGPVSGMNAFFEVLKFINKRQDKLLSLSCLSVYHDYSF